MKLITLPLAYIWRPKEGAQRFCHWCGSHDPITGERHGPIEGPLLLEPVADRALAWMEGAACSCCNGPLVQ